MSINSDIKSCQKGNIYLSKEEKEKQVIELYLARVPYKQIAKIVGMSLRDITRIINEFLRSQKAKPEKSIRAKAFLMFKENKPLVDVVVDLDILPSEVEQMHIDFLRLEDRDFVNEHFALVKKDIPGFVKYHNVMKKNEHPERHKIKLIVDNEYVLQEQKQEFHKLKRDIDKSVDFKEQLELDIHKMKTRYEFYMSKNSI